MEEAMENSDYAVALDAIATEDRLLAAAREALLEHPLTSGMAEEDRHAVAQEAIDAAEAEQMYDAQGGGADAF